MFDLLKVNRINKITRTHSEKISDSLILMNIVNSMDAKKNLTPEEYRSFCAVFDRIRKEKKEIPTNSLQYENRAFAIAYEFEWSAEVPYEKICGDSTDILYMYSNKKPMFEDSLNDLIVGFEDIVSSIINMNNLKENEFRIRSLAHGYFLSSTQTVLGSYTALRTDSFLCFLYEMAFKKLYLSLSDAFIKTDNDLMAYRELTKKMADMHREAYDNTEELDDYIIRYTNSLMFLCGASEDEINKAALCTWLGYLKDYGEKSLEEG